MDFKEKTLKSNMVFDGKVIKVYNDEVKCPSGNISTREIIKHNGGVCILAIVDNKVIMERQYRYAYDEVLYELPAGKLEKNEIPIEAAYREFVEDTGYKANKLIDYGVMYPTCGYSNETIYLYVAQDVIKSHRHLDEDEVIELEYIELDKVIEMIKNNQIKDAKTIILLTKYLLNNK